MRERSAMRASGGPLILLIEDEVDLVTLLTYNLEKEDYRVIAAFEGDEGVLLAAEKHPDLILLDWMLPNRSGIDICR